MEFEEREGFIAVTGGKVWYKSVGAGAKPPLLTLHGGPGFPHDYLEPLAALADERPVIFYDQLGCGKSDRPDDPALWRIERFVEELGQIRAALGLEKIHLLGHSWGTMLAVDYALTRPAGLQRLILASPCLNIPRWLDDLAEYRRQLPLEVQATLTRHEAAGTTDSEEYNTATMEFYRRHVCRLDPWPPLLQQTLDGMGLPVYLGMWGPNEFYMTGNLNTYDRSPRLPEISIPTLFTCGRYDEATPETTQSYQSLLPGAQLQIFEAASHMPHLEQPEAYLKTLRAFLHRLEN